MQSAGFRANMRFGKRLRILPDDCQNLQLRFPGVNSVHFPSSDAKRIFASTLPWFNCKACPYSTRAAEMFPFFSYATASQ